MYVVGALISETPQHTGVSKVLLKTLKLFLKITTNWQLICLSTNALKNKKLAASKAFSIPPAMCCCWNIAKTCKFYFTKYALLTIIHYGHRSKTD